MPFCKIAEKSFIYDVTPLENLYIEEFMRHAPGDFVKVYIYGLMLCYNSAHFEPTIETISKALNLDEKTVSSALEYWERTGLIQRDADGVIFNNAKSIIELDSDTSEPAFRYEEFNKKMHAILGGRALSSYDYERVYDWIELFGMDQDVALRLMEYCIDLKKGEDVPISYMDKVAISWNKKGIKTIEQAEDLIQSASLNRSPSKDVLKRLGMNRTPTKDEHELYLKWNDKGFKRDAVLMACTLMTQTLRPSMAYLDKILEGFAERGITDAKAIEEDIKSGGTVKTEAQKARSPQSMTKKPDGRLKDKRTYSKQDFEAMLDIK